MISDKNKIIKRLVVDTGLSEYHIKLIIDDVFSQMLKAMETNDTVELSGFGRWILYKKKVKRDVEEILNKDFSSLSIETQEKVILLGRELIKRLGDEDNKLVTDFRRLEEQFNTTRGIKGTD